jgi:hypothetical protein
MNETNQTKTVTIKACMGCEGGLLENDKFCRWCGARQTDRLAGAQKSSSLLYTTSALALAPEETTPYRPVSGPFVEAMISGVTHRSTVPLYGRAVRNLIQALLSIPIWLMIILLSPVDAYAAAKNMSNHLLCNGSARES